MDTEICGLNKVRVLYSYTDARDLTVVIEDSLGNTYTKELSPITDKVYPTQVTTTEANSCRYADFVLPGIPSAQRQECTAYYLLPGNSTKFNQQRFLLGFGETKEISLTIESMPISKALAQNIALEAEGRANRLANENLGYHLKIDPTISTGEQFFFAKDNSGRYGYKTSRDGTFHPFKDGSESFCYYLGATDGTKNDLEIDYNAVRTKIKNDYGIELPTTVLPENVIMFTSVSESTTSPNTSIGGGTYNGEAYYKKGSISISSNKIIVTPPKLIASLNQYVTGGYVDKGQRTKYLTAKVFLIKSLN